MDLHLADEVRAAIECGMPVVALESTVIAHGLPYPENIRTAMRCEAAIRGSGAVPATIALIGGEIRIGLSAAEIEALGSTDKARKISQKDLAIAAAMRLDAATTVSGTAALAHKAGIRVFATGGIGGVHRGDGSDVSGDLPTLSRTPITVVCSGAKVILDLPRTREWLETFGVAVLGWETDELPAFYSRRSGLPVDQAVTSAAEVAAIAMARDELGYEAALLVGVPVPAEFELPREEVEAVVSEAIAAANEEGVRGKALTPFLLSRMASVSEGRTLAANIALLENNARVAGKIATAMSETA